MMKILFIVRSTLFTARGGDTIQVQETATALRNLGLQVYIKKSSEQINYAQYDGLHFFNITRPADILLHIKKSGKPFVVSTILINYALYDKHHRQGLAGKLLNKFSEPGIEYLKAIYRFATGKDKLVSLSYLWKGQQASIREILKKSNAVLVQAEAEYDDLVKLYGVSPDHYTVHNGINTCLFQNKRKTEKEKNLVLCVARIEGIKNQYNLIRALNNTAYRLVLIGDAAPNQQDYYNECRKIAAKNISFVSHLPQQQLAEHYAAASVHVLPSWFEVCGLSSLEAAVMGCRVVITGNGYAGAYFNDDAFYCDPAEPQSILEAVENAMAAGDNGQLQQKILQQFTWKKTAEDTLAVYKNIFN
ncbi:MAG: glycosyltransferase family 4 protein [Ferruginibacter sp.]|nr:glycosyltransferase family 4 protein [Ferruginibacter sp.]